MEFILLIAAYLIGSIPTALIVGKVIFKVDIRNHGSGNAGATNSLRVMGKKAGVIVLLVDVAKGALAAALPFLLGIDLNPLFPGLAAVIGHCFPIFAGFRGGKAIATTAGMLMVYSIPMLLIAYATFVIIVILTKYVFMGSLSVGLALLAVSFLKPGIQEELIFFIFTLLLIYLHRSNITNFKNGKEPKVNDKNLKNDRIHPPNQSFKA